MTNLEWIRTMNAVELGRFIRGANYCPKDCDDCPMYSTCDACWVEWLNEDAEVE